MIYVTLNEIPMMYLIDYEFDEDKMPVFSNRLLKRDYRHNVGIADTEKKIVKTYSLLDGTYDLTGERKM